MPPAATLRRLGVECQERAHCQPHAQCTHAVHNHNLAVLELFTRVVLLPSCSELKKIDRLGLILWISPFAPQQRRNVSKFEPVRGFMHLPMVGFQGRALGVSAVAAAAWKSVEGGISPIAAHPQLKYDSNMNAEFGW